MTDFFEWAIEQERYMPQSEGVDHFVGNEVAVAELRSNLADKASRIPDNHLLARAAGKESAL